MSITLIKAKEEFRIFLNLLYSKNINIEEYRNEDCPDQTYYSIPYNDYIINFINSINGIEISFLKQFVALNSFFRLIKGLPNNIYLTINISNYGMIFKLGGNERFTNILSIYVSNEDKVETSCTYYNSSINWDFSYEDAYNKVLSDTKKALSSKIIKTSDFLEMYKKTTESVIQSKLDKSNTRYIDVKNFCLSYPFSENKECLITHVGKVIVYKNNTYYVKQDVFKKMLQDILPENNYRKMLQLMSLGKFQYHLIDEDVNKTVAVYFPIKVSRFSDYNIIIAFKFYDILITLYDDGSLNYENSILDIPVYLDNLEEIYSHLLGETVGEITKVLDMPINKITYEHIKLYKILTF